MPEPTVPEPSPDQRKIASTNFAKARSVIASGNFDYGISLLKTIAALDLKNELYRIELRKTQKTKFNNNLKGSPFGFFTIPGYRTKIKVAKGKRDYPAVIALCEEILTKNPWDLGAQMEEAEAFDALGLINLAVFNLDQARQKFPSNTTLNRALARMFEKAQKFELAAKLWELVLKANKNDVEAQHKAKDLAAQETIRKGGYGVAAFTGEGASGSKMHQAMQAETPTDKMTREAGEVQKRLEANPTEPTLYVQLAAIYRKYGEVDRARAALQQGIGPAGNHFKLRIELLELDLAPARKALEETDAKIKKAKARAADDFDGPSEDELNAVRAKQAKEVLTREIEVLKLRAEGNPNETIHKLELGTRLLKADHVDEAVSVLQRVKGDERLKGKASLLLGVAFRRKGRSGWPLAQRNFDEALKELPASDEANRKEALYHLAVGCSENGDVGRALEVGHELANLDFGYKNIGKLLDDWHAKEGK
jgi:tetratricopeptide (TPR) repeat protein